MPPAILSSLTAAIVSGFSAILGENLVGIYLHGSAALGDFRPERSDVDFLAAVRRRPSADAKLRLLELMLKLEEKAPPKGLEMSLLLADDCRTIRHPMPFELHFSRMHRERCRREPENYVREMRGFDHDLAAYVAVIRKNGRTLCGPPAAEVFGAVPPAALRDSLRRNAAESDADASGVLNLCRYAAFCRNGELLSKTAGGAWGLRHLPETRHELIRQALADTIETKPAVVAACRDFREEILKATDSEMKTEPFF